jgi:hypothetical protein
MKHNTLEHLLLILQRNIQKCSVGLSKLTFCSMNRIARQDLVKELGLGHCAVAAAESSTVIPAIFSLALGRRRI